ncbi:hypothetical protein ACRRTK_001707 [Alexandromys fortis]
MAAVVVQVPGLVPIPVNQLVLSHPCQDFRITEAIVSAAASTMAAKIAISRMATVASTVDSLARQVATALETQNSLNEHICQGIFQLNLQTALYKSS